MRHLAFLSYGRNLLIWMQALWAQDGRGPAVRIEDLHCTDPHLAWSFERIEQEPSGALAGQWKAQALKAMVEAERQSNRLFRGKVKISGPIELRGSSGGRAHLDIEKPWRA
jgi:hypothetical protein